MNAVAFFCRVVLLLIDRNVSFSLASKIVISLCCKQQQQQQPLLTVGTHITIFCLVRLRACVAWPRRLRCVMSTTIKTTKPTVLQFSSFQVKLVVIYCSIDSSQYGNPPTLLLQLDIGFFRFQLIRPINLFWAKFGVERSKLWPSTPSLSSTSNMIISCTPKRPKVAVSPSLRHLNLIRFLSLQFTTFCF